MWKRTPSKFYRLLGWADAEAEAEPIRISEARKKQKAAEKTKGDAQNQVKPKR